MSDERAKPGQPWIIDAAIYVHLAYQAEVSESKRNDGFAASHDPGVSTTGLRLASMIRDLQTRFGFDTALAAWNGPSDRQWRPKYAPTYKSNRSAKAPGLCELLDHAPRIFAELGIASFALDEYEADDVIASACYRHADCVIVSNDKDFYQVLGVNGARIFDPRKRRDTAPKGAIGLTPDAGPAGAWITLEDVIAKFGVGPERVIDVQAIMGDTADGIPGAHGVGAKGAATLIGTYGGLDAVLGADPTVVNGGVAKLLRLVHDARDKVAQARHLVTLATDLDVPVYPVSPPASRGVGAFLNPRNLESKPVSSPFAKILGAPPPPAAPSLKDRLNAEASTTAGAPTPPAPPAPARSAADSVRAACATSARQYVEHGRTVDAAIKAIAPWAANQATSLDGYEVTQIVRGVYAAAGKVEEPPPAPAAPPPTPTPAQHYPTDKAGADVVRSMIRNNADAAVRAGKSVAAAMADARTFNAARPDDVRLNGGEVDQIVAGVFAGGINGAAALPAPVVPPAPAAPPAAPVPAPAPFAAGPINPPDGVPAHLPATDYAPGGALDPSRKAPKEDTVIPAGFGSWSGKTWTSIVKDDAALLQIELLRLLGSGTPKHTAYAATSTCPPKGAKRSDLLADCKLLVAVLTGAALPEVEPADEAPAPQAAPPAPAPVHVATIPELAPRPAPRMVEVPIPEAPPAPIERTPHANDVRIESTPHEPLAHLVGGLFVDCYPTRAEWSPIMLGELVEREGWAHAVAVDLGVVHYGIADYRKGARGIAAHLDAYARAGKLSGTAIVIDTRIDYAGECLAVLEPLAGLVVRRIG